MHYLDYQEKNKLREAVDKLFQPIWNKLPGGEPPYWEERKEEFVEALESAMENVTLDKE